MQGNQPIRSLAIFVVIFTMMVAGIGVSGYFSYQNYERELRSRVERQLVSIAELKARELILWREERLDEASSLTFNAEFISLAQRVMDTPEDDVSYQKLQAWLETFQNAYNYERVILLNPDGEARFSIPRLDEPIDGHLLQDTAEVLSTGQVKFLDFHRDTPYGPIYLSIIAPIYISEDLHLPVGVLVLRINPETFLYPFISQWPIPDETAETVLVRRDGESALFLNPLSFYQNAALNYRIPLTETHVVAVMGVLGQTGIAEGVDYRNTSVLADLRPIQGTSWIMVTKIDADEVYVPLQRRARETVLFFGALMFGSGAGLGMLWWQQRWRFYQAQAALTESLQKSEERYRLLIEHASDGIFIADETGHYVDVNPSGCQMLGYSRDELVGKKITDLIDVDDLAATPIRLDELRQGKTVLAERPLIRKDGSILQVEISARMLPDGRFQAMHRNISERKRVDAIIKQYAARLEEAEKHAMLGSWEFNVTTGKGWWSKQMYRMFDLEISSEVPDFETYLERIHPEDRHIVQDVLMKMSQGLEPVSQEFRNNPAYGPQRYFVPTVYVERDELGNPVKFIGTQLDVTERRKAEQELVRSEKKYRALYESLRDAFVRTDMLGNIIEFNQAYQDLLGYSTDEIIRLKFTDITPEKWHAMEDEIVSSQVLVRGYSDVYEKEYRRRDGVTIPVELRTFLVRDEAGDPSSMWAIVRHIGERKRAEEELKRSNAELEQFAYIASHDLQEPLRMISSYTQLLAKRYEGELDEKAKKYIDYAVDGAVRMQQLINDLLAYSRVGTRGQPVGLTDSHAVLGEVLRNLAFVIQEQRAIITNDDLPVLMADATQLKQLLQNLISNAIKFCKPGLTPEIHVSAVDLGHEWRFSVKDNGIGIDEQYADRIFVIFQRLHTRQEYPGTGIGLAVCKRIVERHGGQIWVKSKPGEGSTFYFTFAK